MRLRNSTALFAIFVKKLAYTLVSKNHKKSWKPCFFCPPQQNTHCISPVSLRDIMQYTFWGALAVSNPNYAVFKAPSRDDTVLSMPQARLAHL